MFDDDDYGFKSFLTDLLSRGVLAGDDKAEGITKRVIEKGVDSLSDKQNYIFKKYVLDQYTYEACTMCGSNIPWSEMLEAHDEGGLCSWCLKMQANREKE